MGERSQLKTCFVKVLIEFNWLGFRQIRKETISDKHCNPPNPLLGFNCLCEELGACINLETVGWTGRRRIVHHHSSVHIRDIWWQVAISMLHIAQTIRIILCFRIRGRLGSVFVLSSGAGILFAYTCGTFFSYTTLPFIYIPLSFLFLIGTMFHPESAHFLVKRDKNDVSDEVDFASKCLRLNSIKVEKIPHSDFPIFVIIKFYIKWYFPNRKLKFQLFSIVAWNRLLMNNRQRQPNKWESSSIA